MAFKNRTFSDEEAIGRVWDVENIKNLIGRFFYYEAANEREAVMNDLWVCLLYTSELSAIATARIVNMGDFTEVVWSAMKNAPAWREKLREAPEEDTAADTHKK